MCAVLMLQVRRLQVQEVRTHSAYSKGLEF